MVGYNLTGIVSNSTSIVGFVQGVNNVLMRESLGIMFLIGVTLVFFIAFIQSTGNTNRAVAASSFLAFGMSIFLAALDLLPELALYITLIGSAAAIAFTWRANSAS